jgi:hypothetical protein
MWAIFGPYAYSILPQLSFQPSQLACQTIEIIALINDDEYDLDQNYVGLFR